MNLISPGLLSPAVQLSGGHVWCVGGGGGEGGGGGGKFERNPEMPPPSTGLPFPPSSPDIIDGKSSRLPLGSYTLRYTPSSGRRRQFIDGVDDERRGSPPSRARRGRPFARHSSQSGPAKLVLRTASGDEEDGNWEDDDNMSSSTHFDESSSVFSLESGRWKEKKESQKPDLLSLGARPRITRRTTRACEERGGGKLPGR